MKNPPHVLLILPIKFEHTHKPLSKRKKKIYFQILDFNIQKKMQKDYDIKINIVQGTWGERE